MYGKKAKDSIGLIISLLFVFVGLAANILWFIVNGTDAPFIPVVMIVLYCFLIYYALSGYKIPHGNLLRYEFIAYSVMNILVLLFYLTHDIALGRLAAYSLAAKALLSIYMAGRLDKIKKNAWIMIAVLALELVYALSFVIPEKLAFIVFLTAFNGTYMWVALCGAYITRYKLHKEAGLTDK